MPAAPLPAAAGTAGAGSLLLAESAAFPSLLDGPFVPGRVSGTTPGAAIGGASAAVPAPGGVWLLLFAGIGPPGGPARPGAMNRPGGPLLPGVLDRAGGVPNFDSKASSPFG
ncbi:MAG: hypothetical protein WEB58_02295 [Planctomycetaceae bacterium]